MLTYQTLRSFTVGARNCAASSRFSKKKPTTTTRLYLISTRVWTIWVRSVIATRCYGSPKSKARWRQTMIYSFRLTITRRDLVLLQLLLRSPPKPSPGRWWCTRTALCIVVATMSWRRTFPMRKKLTCYLSRESIRLKLWKLSRPTTILNDLAAWETHATSLSRAWSWWLSRIGSYITTNSTGLVAILKMLVVPVRQSRRKRA